MKTSSRVSEWFEELRRIWLEKDINSLQNILAKEFYYYEDPYEKPLQSWLEVEEAWQEVYTQNIKRLEIHVLIGGETKGSGSYDFAYEDSSGVLHESKGAYYLRLDSEGKAIEFRQWWTVK